MTDAHSATVSRSARLGGDQLHDRPRPHENPRRGMRLGPLVDQIESAHEVRAQVSRKRLTANAEPATPMTIPTTTMNTTITVSSPVGTSRLVW